MLTELQMKRYKQYRKKGESPSVAKRYAIKDTEWFELGGYTCAPKPDDHDESESHVRVVWGWDEFDGDHGDWLDEKYWSNKRQWQASKKEIERLEENEGYYMIASEFRNPETGQWELVESLGGILGEKGVMYYMDEFQVQAIDAFNESCKAHAMAVQSRLSVLV